LKRVDGLEAKLKEKNAEEASPTTPVLPVDSSSTAAPETQSPVTGEPGAKKNKYGCGLIAVWRRRSLQPRTI
jgi:hypothetical protein